MDTPLYLLSDTARLLRRALNARVRQLGMTSVQARLLLSLSKAEGENQGFYAERLDVEPITLCRLIDRMEDGGLLERRRDPADRRAWRVHLTERSREQLDAVRASLVGLEDDVLKGMNPAQRDVLTELLENIRTNIGEARTAEGVSNG